MKVLVVEDDEGLAQSLQASLRGHYECQLAHTAADGYRLALAGVTDLVILDVDLPDFSGLEVCRRLRDAGATFPIIFLTGKLDSIDDKVSGLDVGGDDYLLKPIHEAELLARVRAILRRHQSKPADAKVRFEDLTLNPANRTVVRGGETITLRRKEFDLLEYLLRNPQRVVTRDMILHHVWGSEVDIFTNAVDVHIKYLRDKIDKPYTRKLIKTVHGIGYKIE